MSKQLIVDARAAGIVEITALVRGDDPAAFAVLRRVLGRLEFALLPST